MIRSGGECSNGMQSGADSLATVATWWQKVFTLGSALKNEPGLRLGRLKLLIFCSLI